MTIAKIAFPGIASRIYVPEGPYGSIGTGPMPSYDPGDCTDGDKEGEFVFVKLGVTGPLTLNQGDVLVWDQTFTAVQSATGAGAHAIGSAAGTFFLGGRIGDLAGGPYPLTTFQYTFPLSGVYGVWAQRNGASLINCATNNPGNSLNTTAVAGQVNAPATPLTGSVSIAQAWVAKNSFTFTGTTAANSNTITGVSTNAGLAVGQSLSGTGIPTGAFITDIQGASVVMSANATASGSGVTLTARDLATAGNTTTGSNLITGVANLPVIYPNQGIAGAGIPAGAVIQSIGGNPGAYTITISANATATAAGVALTTSGYVQAMLRRPFVSAQN